METIPGAAKCQTCRNPADLCDVRGFYFVRCKTESCGELKPLLRADEDPWIEIGAFHAEAISREYRGEVNQCVWSKIMSLESLNMGCELSSSDLDRIWRSATVQGVILLARIDQAV